MCLYMSVPQWLNLQNFLKAINESINHTIHVSLMFIYFKCLNNTSNNKNQQQQATINTKTTTTTTTQIIAKQTIEDKNHHHHHHHKIDFNVNIKKVNSFEIFTLHKACNEIGQMERMLTMQHKNPQLNQQKRDYHLPPVPTLFGGGGQP